MRRLGRVVAFARRNGKLFRENGQGINYRDTETLRKQLKEGESTVIARSFFMISLYLCVSVVK